MVREFCCGNSGQHSINDIRTHTLQSACRYGGAIAVNVTRCVGRLCTLARVSGFPKGYNSRSVSCHQNNSVAPNPTTLLSFLSVLPTSHGNNANRVDYTTHDALANSPSLFINTHKVSVVLFSAGSILRHQPDSIGISFVHTHCFYFSASLSITFCGYHLCACCVCLSDECVCECVFACAYVSAHLMCLACDAHKWWSLNGATDLRAANRQVVTHVLFASIANEKVTSAEDDLKKGRSISHWMVSGERKIAKHFQRKK